MLVSHSLLYLLRLCGLVCKPAWTPPEGEGGAAGLDACALASRSSDGWLRCFSALDLLLSRDAPWLYRHTPLCR